MQTPHLSIQSASAVPASMAPASRPKDGAVQEASQFSQALSREIGQRQAADAAAPDKDGSPAAGEAKEPDASVDTTVITQASNAALMPVADMLALVASLTLPQQPAKDDAVAGASAVVASGVPASLVAVAGRTMQAAAGAPVALSTALPGAMLANAATEAPSPGLPAVRPFALEPATTSMGKPDAVGTQATAPTPRPEVRAAPALAIDHGRGHAPVRSVIEEILPAAGPQAALPPQAAALVAPTPHGIGATSDKIGARVGTPGWDNQLGQKIVWMVAGKEQSATLTLNPPDMGPMQVVLSVNNDQASVTFTAAQPEVRQALENAMPKLREMMGESGISLANANVTEGSAGQRQAASEQGQPRHAGGRGGAEPNTGATDAEARAGARPVRVGELRGLVDTFA